MRMKVPPQTAHMGLTEGNPGIVSPLHYSCCGMNKEGEQQEEPAKAC